MQTNISSQWPLTNWMLRLLWCKDRFKLPKLKQFKISRLHMHHSRHTRPALDHQALPRYGLKKPSAWNLPLAWPALGEIRSRDQLDTRTQKHFLLRRRTTRSTLCCQILSGPIPITELPSRPLLLQRYHSSRPLQLKRYPLTVLVRQWCMMR